MTDSTTDCVLLPLPQSKDVLTDVLRQGAQKLLSEAEPGHSQEVHGPVPGYFRCGGSR